MATVDQSAPKAFVLGAGLGTRLRPLTDRLPKPLVPLVQRPLITYAFDHLIGIGVGEFVVNTHHLPDAYSEAFPDGSYSDLPITFRHEPVLLETAGGIANVADLLDGNAPFVVYNGDILTDIPLQEALDFHRSSGRMVTLVLRSRGDNCNVSFDSDTGLVRDMRGALARGTPEHQFTGIYIVEPAFLQHLEPGKKESVVPIFLKLIESSDAIGGFVSDGGTWWDLGEREAYLDAHEALLDGEPSIHPDAEVHETAEVRGSSVVAADCVVGEGAILEDTVLWVGAKVEPWSRLARCIVRDGVQVAGEHTCLDA